MANLTVTIPDLVLKRARIRAIEDGTSVNAMVGEFLHRYAGLGESADALAAFVDIASGVDASSGPGGRSWRRDELYDRPVMRTR